MVRLQITFNNPRYKMATGFIKRNDYYFLNFHMNSHQVIVKAYKKIQTKPFFDTDCLSYHATRKTWLKKDTTGSSHLYPVLDKWPSVY